MGTTVQILRKLAYKEEDTAGTYDAPDTLVPMLSSTIRQSFDMIDDESIIGQAFPDLPVQGLRHISGSVSQQVDVLTIDPLLEMMIGAAGAAGVYTSPTTTNPSTLSFVGIDEVKTYKYAGCVANSVEFTSEAGGDLRVGYDVIGWKAETRDDTAFPAITNNPGTRLVHHHCGGTNGYVRIADQGDALAAGDNQDVMAISIGLNWNFAEDPTNAQGTLQLLSASGGRPVPSFSFTVNRHDADTWHAARDARTALQADIKYYAGAAAILQFEIPNFVISDLTPTEDDINRIEVTCALARNGIGASYSNSNMSFNAPIRPTLTNS